MKSDKGLKVDRRALCSRVFVVVGDKQKKTLLEPSKKCNLIVLKHFNKTQWTVDPGSSRSHSRPPEAEQRTALGRGGSPPQGRQRAGGRAGAGAEEGSGGRRGQRGAFEPAIGADQDPRTSAGRYSCLAALVCNLDRNRANGCAGSWSYSAAEGSTSVFETTRSKKHADPTASLHLGMLSSRITWLLGYSQRKLPVWVSATIAQPRPLAPKREQGNASTPFQRSNRSLCRPSTPTFRSNNSHTVPHVGSSRIRSFSQSTRRHYDLAAPGAAPPVGIDGGTCCRDPDTVTGYFRRTHHFAAGRLRRAGRQGPESGERGAGRA